MTEAEVRALIADVQAKVEAVAVGRAGAKDGTAHEAPSDAIEKQRELFHLLTGYQQKGNALIDAAQAFLNAGYPNLPSIEVAEDTLVRIDQEVQEQNAMRTFFTRAATPAVIGTFQLPGTTPKE